MKIILIAILTLVMCSGTLFGASEYFSNRITGSSITSGGSAPQLTLYDSKYFDMLTNPIWSSSYTNVSIKNKIVLGINPAVEQNNALSGGVTFNLKYWYWNGSSFSTTTVTGLQLAVNYSLTETDIIDEIQSYTFSNASRIEVTITSVNGGAGFDVNDVYLDAVTEVERNYTFSSTTAITGTLAAVSSSGDFIEFQWNNVVGAEYYELEWVHVNDYDVANASTYVASSAVAYDFYRNSTRVMIGTNNYKIPNVFDHGYLFFRVRGVGLWGPQYDKRFEGVWNIAESGTASGLTAATNYLHITDAYTNGDPLDPVLSNISIMNWAHQVVYAEDGKRMEGISYTDGLGRPRQSLGLNPVTEQILVNNVYYGGMGAATMGDLATPVESQNLHHLVNFNRAAGDSYYGAVHFDDQTDEDAECVYTATDFDQNYGAGKYYSVNNPDQAGANVRIPDANGFPFAKVEYMKDQTGRIRSAGGVGKDFQIGQGHESKVYYDTPDQFELDRLFGTEAGIADHYQRRITVDANNQAYAEYFDMAGRLVASCLMGDAPDNLESLSNNIPVSKLVVMNSGIGANEETATSLKLTKHFQAPNDGDYTFNYSIEPSSYSDGECLPEICFDCVYKLSISITDVNCGDEMFGDDVYINGEEYNAICDGTSPYVLNEVVHLPAGSYVLNKLLEIAPEATSEYWCTYIDNNTCVPTYAEIFNELYLAQDFDDCDEEIPGEEVIEEGCSALLPLLLADVSPGGQYGQYTVSAGVYSSTDPISVLYTSNSLPGGGDWLTPSGGEYKDALGATAYVEITEVSTGVYSPAISGGPVLGPFSNGKYKVKPTQLLNLRDFVLLFEDSWAEALLPYHPEYCYWRFCEANTTSEDYSNQMSEITTYDEACLGGFLAPLGTIVTTNAYSMYSGCATSPLDPAFDTGGWGDGTIASDMANEMASYIVIDGLTLSMWDYAIMLANCPEETDAGNITTCVRDGVTCANYDQVWLNFRDLYLALKNDYYAEAENDYVQTCGGGVADDVGVSSPYASATPRFGLYYDGLSTTTTLGDITTAAADMCEDLAEAQVEEWMSALAGCPEIASMTTMQKDDLAEDLVALCSYGCSVDHMELATTLPATLVTSPFVLPASTGNLYGGDGINEVLAIHISGFTESDLCTELLISSPKPYTENEQAPAVLDECGCDLLLGLKAEFEALKDLPEGVVTIEDYLYYVEGFTLEDIDYLICACESVTKNTWNPSYEWQSGDLERLEVLNLYVPNALTCDECLDCRDLDDADEALEHIFGSEFTSSVNYQTIFTNYMNLQYNFTLGYGDYARFRAKCSGTSENPYCEVTDEFLNFGNVLDLLARRGQLATGVAIDLMADNIVYKQGALNEVLGAEHYKGEADGNNLAIRFRKDGEWMDCTTTLTLPEDPGFDFTDIIGFENPQPVEANCGTNVHFTIGVRYIKCGKIEFAELTGATDCFEITNCYCSTEGVMLCNESLAEGLADSQLPCYEPELSHIISDATESYNAEMEAAYTTFVADYNSKCSAAFKTEEITREGWFNQYQYTLFYYDQPGNLIKTVAPMGVVSLTGTDLDDVITSRDGTTGIDDQETPVLPTHGYLTEYHHNSYGQVTETINPDQVGATRYFYDRLGRIVSSQNPVQYAANLYTYILYDDLGRPRESGLVSKLADPSDADLKANDLGAAFENWVKYTSAATTTRTEVVFTYYDDIADAAFSAKFKNGQKNLRLRVASVFQVATCTNSTNVFTAYESAVHYSYDIHGNVVENIQDVPALAPVKQDVKSTRYEFELISGNVKKVKYQEEEYNTSNSTWEAGRDRMTHEYKYDKLNRLTDVYTSTDGEVHKSHEARYEYFDYGPLARTEIGEHKVQGNDFTYTLQGWIKGMNSNSLNREHDPGADGTLGYASLTSNVHEHFAKDVTGFSLGYFTDDYKSIGFTDFTSQLDGGFASTIKDLYNGNIAYTVSAIDGYRTQGSAYKYDQLQRLTRATVFESSDVAAYNSWYGSSATGAYNSSYSYDENGNLRELIRNGDNGANSYAMDAFTYNYTSGMNRLEYVDDAAGIADSDYSEDIDSGQGSPNYLYDELGQLIFDDSESMTLVWRNGNKKLASQENASKRVEYIYNPFGQRVLKVEKNMSSGSVVSESVHYGWKYTYYAYDANGQVMATYDVLLKTYAVSSTIYHEYMAKADEQLIYGAGRIGLIAADKLLYDNSTGYAALEAPKYTNKLGKKNYELTNHLGNVNAVITDRKMLDADYSLGVWHDFSSSISWATVSGTPSINYSGNELNYGTATATTASSYRTEATVASKTYSFSLDISDRNAVSNFSIELYKNNTNDLVTPTLLKTFTTGELVNGTTISYTYTTAASGDDYFVYKLVKTSTESAYVKLDNLKFKKSYSRYKAVVIMKADYYPYGMVMPGRKWNNGNYRYGYNGMEQDIELKGNGNSYTTEFRQYDPRLGRWMSLDPLMAKYSWMSPYMAFNDNPVLFVDPFGLEGKPVPEKLPDLTKDGPKDGGRDVPTGKLPAFDVLKSYTYDWQTEKWKVKDDWRLKSDKAFREKMNLIAGEAAKISKNARKKYGFKLSKGTDDLFFESYQQPMGTDGDYPINLGLVRVLYYSKNGKKGVEVVIPTHEHSINSSGGGTSGKPYVEENVITVIDDATIADYYTNCFADVLGIIGMIDEVSFQYIMENDYDKISDTKNAKPGDIFYSNSLEGGIGHAMTLLEIKVVDGKKIGVFRSNFLFGTTVTGTLQEIALEQQTAGFLNGLSVYRKKK